MNKPALQHLPPGATIGILGGGQLGRMLALSALKLGFHIHVFCQQENSPAFETARQYWQAGFDDLEALKDFASSCDVITYEFENIPAATLERAEEFAPVAPGLKALEIAQDRLNEKAFMTSLGIPVAPFMKVDNVVELELALQRIGHDSLLKTRRMGYDGKGQVSVNAQSEARSLWEEIGGQPAILEQKVSFLREVSVLVVRTNSEMVRYDVCENLHLDQMLRRTRIPAQLDPEVRTRAQDMAEQIAVALDYVGVLAVEMFVLSDQLSETCLMVNEIAPRVHNSGHWTESACVTSQFENHVRAVCGWPLGAVRRHSDVVMTNIIGEDVLEWETLAADPEISLHLYGKEKARPGRKMGHANRLLPLRSNLKIVPKEG